jgi:mono/diheme cytochrome c family protein
VKRLIAGAVGAATLAAGLAVVYGALNRTDDAAGTAPLIAGAPPTADVLARGEYLATAADCIACHTVSDSHQPFAGGVAFKLPIGIIYSSNITADPVSGIGRWSDDEFVRAVREGVRNDGQHLYPAFPYTSYTRLARSDVLAIKAYLMSLPAIPQANRANTLRFPFNQRWAMGFWNAAFFKSGRFAADPSKSPGWNGGAYLASALGHCAECHTPRNFGFGLVQGEEFSGAELSGWRAYNITSDPVYGIGAWSDAEIAGYLKTGHAQGRGSASGPMGEAVAYSLQYLSPADIAALVEYLRGVLPRKGRAPIVLHAPPAEAEGSGALEPNAAARSAAAAGGRVAAAHGEGRQLFEGACASCHPYDGRGQESPYASLLGARSVNDVSAANVTEAILQGGKLRMGGSDVFMPAFGAGYSDTDVAALANYVVAQFGGKTGTVTADDVAKRRAL